MHRKIIFASLLFFTVFFICGDSFACSAIANTNCPYINPANGQYQIFYAILCTVQSTLTGTLMNMYYGSILPALAGPIHIILIIYIVLFGYAFMLGIAGTEPGEFVIRVVKLAVVYALTIGDSQNNCTFFTYIFNFFMSGLHQFAVLAVPAGGIAAGNGAVGSDIANSSLFANLDAILSTQLTTLAMAGAVILAFMLLGPGIIVSAMLSMGMFTMFKALLNVFKTLLIAIISLTLALMFAPIFLCFFLFKETRDLFDNWLSILITYTLQPGIVFFYFMMITGPLTSIGSVITQIEQGGIIAAKVYQVNLLVGTFQFNGYQLNPGIVPCTVCASPPPVTLTTPINFKLQGGGTSQLPLMFALLLYALQWIILSVVTTKFMEMVPDIATRISTIGSPLHTPRLGANQSAGGEPIAGGIILPGVTSGFGAEEINKEFTDRLGKLQIGSRFMEGATKTRRMFQPFTTEEED